MLLFHTTKYSLGAISLQFGYMTLAMASTSSFDHLPTSQIRHIAPVPGTHRILRQLERWTSVVVAVEVTPNNVDAAKPSLSCGQDMKECFVNGPRLVRAVRRMG